MKKSTSILWGIVLIVVGVLVAINALGIADVNLFFDGWWTLFIIVPCAIGLFTDREKTDNIIGIIIGVFLLLCCQDVLSFGLFWKLLIPAIIIIIGVKMIFGGLFSGKANEVIKKLSENKDGVATSCAAFSGNDLNFDSQEFKGADLTAVFGGVKLDLRNAIITEDCAVKVCAVFGGIDILVPPNVNVKVNSTCLFGGVSNKTKLYKDNTVTVYVSGVCMFGGVDVK